MYLWLSNIDYTILYLYIYLWFSCNRTKPVLLVKIILICYNKWYEKCILIFNSMSCHNYIFSFTVFNIVSLQNLGKVLSYMSILVYCSNISPQSHLFNRRKIIGHSTYLEYRSIIQLFQNPIEVAEKFFDRLSLVRQVSALVQFPAFRQAILTTVILRHRNHLSPTREYNKP